MESKGSWLLLAVVLLAALFSPMIPNDEPITCSDTGKSAGCDENVGYISAYEYFIKQ